MYPQRAHDQGLWFQSIYVHAFNPSAAELVETFAAFPKMRLVGKQTERRGRETEKERIASHKERKEGSKENERERERKGAREDSRAKKLGAAAQSGRDGPPSRGTAAWYEAPILCELGQW